MNRRDAIRSFSLLGLVGLCPAIVLAEPAIKYIKAYSFVHQYNKQVGPNEYMRDVAFIKPTWRGEYLHFESEPFDYGDGQKIVAQLSPPIHIKDLPKILEKQHGKHKR